VPATPVLNCQLALAWCLSPSPVKERAAKRIPIVEAPASRRDEFVDPYFERAKPDAVVVNLKAR
jgi:hypothetical protein